MSQRPARGEVLPRERRCYRIACTVRSLPLTAVCLLAVLAIGVPFLLTELFSGSNPTAAAAATSVRRKRDNGTGVTPPSKNGTVRPLLSHGPAHAAIDLVCRAVEPWSPRRSRLPWPRLTAAPACGRQVFLSEAYEATAAEAFFADAARIVAEHFAQPEAPFVGPQPGGGRRGACRRSL